MKSLLKKINLRYFTIILFICCNDNNNDKVLMVNSTSTNYNKLDSVSIWARNAIEKGDTLSYLKVSSYYIFERPDVFDYSDLFISSYLMANEHNYSEAYFDLFYILSQSHFKFNLEKTGKNTKNFALFCLLKSYELGSSNSKHWIKINFKNNIPSSKDYVNLLGHK